MQNRMWHWHVTDVTRLVLQHHIVNSCPGTYSYGLSSRLNHLHNISSGWSVFYQKWSAISWLRGKTEFDHDVILLVPYHCSDKIAVQNNLCRLSSIPICSPSDNLSDAIGLWSCMRKHPSNAKQSAHVTDVIDLVLHHHLVNHCSETNLYVHWRGKPLTWSSRQRFAEPFCSVRVIRLQS